MISNNLKPNKMKTIREYKNLLNSGMNQDNEKEFFGNTVLGMHLNGLFKEQPGRADIHNLEEKVEVICQMYKNGIDCFNDSYKLGSVSKAYYQLKLAEYSEFK